MLILSFKYVFSSVTVMGRWAAPILSMFIIILVYIRRGTLSNRIGKNRLVYMLHAVRIFIMIFDFTLRVEKMLYWKKFYLGKDDG